MFWYCLHISLLLHVTIFKKIYNNACTRLHRLDNLHEKVLRKRFIKIFVTF